MIDSKKSISGKHRKTNHLKCIYWY